MGDTADAMLDGTLCNLCGVVTGKQSKKDRDIIEPWGFPVWCYDCAKDLKPQYKASPGRAWDRNKVFYSTAPKGVSPWREEQ